MGRSISVGLSFLGDGRVLRLTQRNVRTAISHLRSTSTSSMRQIFDLIAGLSDSPVRSVPIVDRLLKYRCGSLTQSELNRVERLLNNALIEGLLQLPPDEPKFQQGTLCSGAGGRSHRRGLGLFYNGVLFEVRQISMAEMLSGGPRDVILEETSGRLHFARFQGVGLNTKTIVFCSRYEISKPIRRLVTLWQSRRLSRNTLAVYSVIHAQPTGGFHFEGCAKFLHG